MRCSSTPTSGEADWLGRMLLLRMRRLIACRAPLELS
jgi:hypothetical protein